MKNKLLGIASILGLAALVLVFLGCPEKGSNAQRKGKYGVTIRPKEGGYPKFEEKWRDIQAVLNRYPYLYYIEEFKAGKQVGPRLGNSCDLLPLANLVKVREKAEALQYSGHAVQIGLGLSIAVEDSECLGVDNCPEDETLVSHSPQAHYKKYIQDSEEMTKKIKKILDGSDAAGSTPGG